MYLGARDGEIAWFRYRLAWTSPREPSNRRDNLPRRTTSMPRTSFVNLRKPIDIDGRRITASTAEQDADWRLEAGSPRDAPPTAFRHEERTHE